MNKRDYGFYRNLASSGCIVCLSVMSMIATFNSAAVLAADMPVSDEDLGAEDLGALSIEQLMAVEVTSVAKKPQKISQSAAAIHVIGREDIRRSGATRIPELLKGVAGLDVARIDGNQWVVGSRGGAGRFSTGLLVLVDGRSVYSPFFSGVYWETVDVSIQDIERIEVIRGPGGSIWGANAVNGVINIITRHSADTQRGMASVVVGNRDQVSVSVREGGELQRGRFGRMYARLKTRGSSVALGGDAGEMARLGFRVDDHPSARNSFRLSGELYDADFDQTIDLPTFDSNALTRVVETVSHQGAHLLGHWRQVGEDGSSLNLQGYWDYYERKETLLNQSVHTLDVTVDQRLALGLQDSLVWGGGMRYSKVSVNANGATFRMTTQLANPLVLSSFVQGEWALSPHTLLTVGSKLERNNYTGIELQPSLRLHWRGDGRRQWWASMSRAVRTPTVLESNFESATGLQAANPPAVPFGTVFSIRGNRQFESEQLVAMELGYRALLNDDWSVDAVLFNHNFSNLRSVNSNPLVLTAPTGPFLLASDLVNNSRARMQGLELGSLLQATERWRIKLAYSYLNLTGDRAFIADGPQHTLSLRSEYDFANGIELDVGFRHRSRVLSIPIGNTRGVYAAFDSLDVRLGWRLGPELELSLVGQNLLDPARVEQLNEVYAPATEVGRRVFIKADWRF